MTWPNPLSGSSPLSAWLNRLLAAARSNELLSGIGYRIRQTTGGKILEINPGPGGGLGGDSVKKYIIADPPHGSVGDADYVLARPDGDDLADPVKILKPYLMRFSLEERIANNGTDIAYSDWDTDGQSRVATTDSGTVTQFITPSYAPGDEIYVMKAPSGDSPATLIDMNLDGRVFAAPDS